MRRTMNVIGDTSMTAADSTAAANSKPTQPLKCPRCDSANTKFCYYNNYSLSQPRHFCKACKRYWTRGGTLRNVPVGGGCRKNKRVRKAPSAAAAAAAVGASLPTATTSDHLNSLFFGPAAVPNPTLPPMYDLQAPHLPIQLGFGGGLADLHLSGGFLSDYPVPSFDQVKVEGENNVTILDWQAQAQAQDPHEMMMNQFEATDSSYMYCDVSNFSLAPLM